MDLCSLKLRYRFMTSPVGLKIWFISLPILRKNGRNSLFVCNLNIHKNTIFVFSMFISVLFVFWCFCFVCGFCLVGFSLKPKCFLFETNEKLVLSSLLCSQKSSKADVCVFGCLHTLKESNVSSLKILSPASWWYRHWELVVLFWRIERKQIIPFSVSVFWGLFWDVVWLTPHLIQHIPVRNMFQVRALLSPPEFHSITEQSWCMAMGQEGNLRSPNDPGKHLGVQPWAEVSPGLRWCSELQGGRALCWSTFRYSLELFRIAFSLGMNVWFLSC